MDKGIAHINYQTCMACGICVGTCPFSYLALSKTGIDSFKKAYPILIAEHSCTGCGLCAAACPVDSITIRP